MTIARSALLVVALLSAFGTAPGVLQAQSVNLVVLTSFNPPEQGSFCSLGLDTVTEELWGYPCSSSEIYRYSKAGTFLGTLPRPGEAANDVDIDFTIGPLTLGEVALGDNTALFINGETDEADIYALDAAGNVVATLMTGFGVSHVVGGAHHPSRNSLFLVQDRAPSGDNDDIIAEVDSTTGSVIDQFTFESIYSVNFGDIEVCPVTGNLLVISSSETTLMELNAEDGSLVDFHALPIDLEGISGLAIETETSTIWAASTSGTIYQLGGFPCGTSDVIFADGFENTGTE